MATDSVTLDEAMKLLDGARRKAEALDIVIAVAVVDGAGHPVAAMRMDGCRYHLAHMAQGKAFMASAMHRPTQPSAPGNFFASGPIVAGGQMIALIGGYPLTRGEEFIGAIGTAGSTDENDEACARAGLDLVPEIQAVWDRL